MKLKKELNLVDVFCIATGAMISSGLFILPGIAHAQAGPAVILSYFFAGLLALTGMLSQAELVSAMPKTGGTYFFVTRSMGPAAGTIDGLITWFSMSLKSAFALIGMAAFTKIIVDIDIHIISISLCFLFIVINLIGIKEAGRLQVFLVFGLISILLFYIVKGIPAVNVNYFRPFAPKGIPAIFSTAGFVFVSYGGLIKVASIAEEVKNPEKTIPIGMILSLFVVSIIYTLVVFITSGVLGAAKLDNSLTPISDAANVFMTDAGVILLSVAAILAFVSTANAGIMAASRYPLALARDDLIPEFFGNISRKFRTPYVAIIVTGIFISSVLFLKLELFVKMASTALILTFLFSCLSVIIMRESGVQNYEPKFISPLYPWIQIVGIVGFLLMIFEMGFTTLYVSLLFIFGGLFVYWFYGRIRTTREYALLHLIQRITARELTDHLLETELKEIIRERDTIIKDRFDHIIESCSVLDIEESMNYKDFFKMAAQALSPNLKMEESAINELLLKREKETSTVIGSGIAIPHIIIEGEKVFDMLLVRCIPGIEFPDCTQKIQTVFVLLGTRDERNFHIRALAAIAQVVQNPNFQKKWLSSRSIEALRDVILLSERMRNEIQD